MTTLDPPTVPLPAFTISPDELLVQRRKGDAYRIRRRDLERAAQPGGILRDEARAIAARMDAWPDTWPEEHVALRDLMRRHGLTARLIRDDQRRAAITRKP